tara:strand:+ start:156 stop:512 length:357 start_codon:yes stop_codon:yes gene_type:complete
MLLIKFIFLFLFISKEVSSEADICEISNITKIKSINNCENNDLLFGYFEFSSQKSNHFLMKIEKYNIEVIKKYHSIFTKYIDNYCIQGKDIRIKNITNYNKIKKNFSTKVIITCNLKK